MSSAIVCIEAPKQCHTVYAMQTSAYLAVICSVFCIGSIFPMTVHLSRITESKLSSIPKQVSMLLAFAAITTSIMMNVWLSVFVNNAISGYEIDSYCQQWVGNKFIFGTLNAICFELFVLIQMKEFFHSLPPKYNTSHIPIFDALFFLMPLMTFAMIIVATTSPQTAMEIEVFSAVDNPKFNHCKTSDIMNNEAYILGISKSLLFAAVVVVFCGYKFTKLPYRLQKICAKMHTFIRLNIVCLLSHVLCGIVLSISDC